MTARRSTPTRTTRTRIATVLAGVALRGLLFHDAAGCPELPVLIL